LSRARIFEWHKKFKEGRDSDDYIPRYSRPTTNGIVSMSVTTDPSKSALNNP